MSKMETVLRRVVKEDISNSTTQIDAIYEAIVNSIHAKATRVICRFLGDQEILKSDDEEEITTKKVVAIEVEDNGQGFTNENYQSFCKYRSDHKIVLGCRGVGRFVFLKLFSDVSYTSWLSADNVKREFSLSLDFDSDDLRQTEEEVPENKTVLTMKGVTSDHFGRDRHADRRLDLDLSRIREEVRLHLIPALYFCKKDGSHVQVDFLDVLTGQSLSLSEKDIPDLKTAPLNINNTDGTEVPFELHYHIEEKAGRIDAFYCANRRSVCTFVSQGLTHRGFKGILLLESEFLDEAVDNFRNDFNIYPIQTDMIHKLSWEMINRGVKPIVAKLVREQIPTVDQKNREQLQEIQEERPYLIEYIEEEDLDIAGFVSKHQIIAKAKKRFEEAKDNLLSNAGKDEYTDDELNEAIQLTQNELVAYIRDRVEVIARLKTMMVNKEKTEALIHNLFMKKYTDDAGFDYFGSKRNNLWLLDDRFTSYSYAASDKRIREILGTVGSDSDDDLPDISLFFSQSPENKAGLKSVIIEFKSFNNERKYANKKMSGITQLLDYVDAFQKKEGIESVWAFLVTDVDERFAGKLERDGYKPLFSTQRAIYHRYYDKPDISIYVVSAESLVSDAEARNKVFIDIITKHSRLRDFLGK